MPLVDRVRRFVEEHGLARPVTRVVVALSGGSDSMALAHLLRELAAAGDLQVVGVAHFNHQLRAAADADERFVRAAADALGWPVVVEREDVAARARRERRSLEDAGRTARHAFFERARQHVQADAVALGHTRDDQAETFLLRLLRGAGPRGLASMHPRRGAIVRPLLACRRTELRAYLAERHIDFVEDETNADTSIPRNRVRAELLPLLSARFNPNIVDVLADEAELARETWDWLVAASEALTESASAAPEHADGRRVDGRMVFDVATLRAAPRALRRVVLWRAMTAAAGGRTVSFAHVELVLRLMEEDSGRIDAPGQRVDRVGACLVLTGRPSGTVGRWKVANPAVTVAQANLVTYPLPIPGEVTIPDAGCVVSVEHGSADAPRGASGAVVSNDATAVVRSDLCLGGLSVRSRRPGDKFRPVGLGGQKKLQDFFVDRKVARERRDSVPLVVDDTDRIVWVAGYGIDEAFRVTDPAQAVLILRLRQTGRSVDDA